MTEEKNKTQKPHIFWMFIPLFMLMFMWKKVISLTCEMFLFKDSDITNVITQEPHEDQGLSIASVEVCHHFSCHDNNKKRKVTENIG